MKVCGITQSYTYSSRLNVSRAQTFGLSAPRNAIRYSEEYLRSSKSPINIIESLCTGIKDKRLEKLAVTKHIKEPRLFELPNDYIFMGDDGYLYVKPHLYINRIQVKREFLRQGVCREVEKRIVEISKELGFEGRVILTSAPITGTEDMIPSPTLAHYKNGFRFYNEKANNLVERILRGEIPACYTPNGTMYYPLHPLR